MGAIRSGTARIVGVNVTLYSQIARSRRKLQGMGSSGCILNPVVSVGYDTVSVLGRIVVGACPLYPIAKLRSSPLPRSTNPVVVMVSAW